MGKRVNEPSVKEQVRAVLMWPRPNDGEQGVPARPSAEEVRRRLREWLKSEKDG